MGSSVQLPLIHFWCVVAFVLIHSEIPINMTAGSFKIPTSQLTESQTLREKVGAHLWEVQSQPKLRVANMSKYCPELNHFGEEACGVFRQVGEAQPETSAEQQNSGVSLGNQVALLLAERNQRIKRVEQSQQTVSPSSYRSSLVACPTISVRKHRVIFQLFIGEQSLEYQIHRLD